MVKPLSLYLVFTCFNTDMVSDFPLLLHAWTDLKYIFLDFVCRKGLPFTKKQSMASSTFWWCLAIRGGKGVIVMVLWCSRLLLIALPCMMGILRHRCELPGNYPVFTVVMVIYTSVRRITHYYLTPNFSNYFIYIWIQVYNLSRRTIG